MKTLDLKPIVADRECCQAYWPVVQLLSEPKTAKSTIHLFKVMGHAQFRRALHSSD